MLCTQSGLGGEAELAYETEPLHRCSGRRAIHHVSRLMGERTDCDVTAASLREVGRQADVRPAALAWQRRRRAAGWPGEAQTKPSVIRSHCGMKGTRLRLLENLHQAEKLNEGIHRLKDALRSPPRLFLHVRARIPGLFWFSGRSGEKEPGTGPVQPGCRGCVVWSIPPMLCASSSATKRARGREGRKKELVRQERKLMAVFKKNDGGE